MGIHPEGDINVCTKFNHNPSDICGDILVWTNMMD